MTASVLTTPKPCASCPFAQAASVPLTERQAELLTLIAQSLDSRGVAPTFDEMGESLGVTSAATVSEHLEHLRARGYIVRTPMAPRGIALSIAGLFWWADRKEHA